MANKKEKKPLTKKQRRRRRRRRLLITELVLLVVLGGMVYFYSKFGKINFEDIGNVTTNKLDAKTKELLSGYTTIALYGVDSRDMTSYKNSQSDSMIICVIDNKKKEIRMMSVYRDTYLDMDGNYKLRKCNSAYAHGGPKESMEMLNRNLDLDIQEYVTVNWKALADAIDVAGGVEVDVTEAEAKALVDPKHFVLENTEDVIGRKTTPVKAGHRKLDGVQAVAYCRIRYGVGDDFGRATRQRAVLASLMEKVKGEGVTKLTKYVDAIFPKVSTSLSMSQIIGLATNVSEYKMAETAAFPFYEKGGKFPGKGYIMVPCTLEDNVKKTYEYLYNKKDYEPSETVQLISKKIVRSTGWSSSSSVEPHDDADTSTSTKTKK